MIAPRRLCHLLGHRREGFVAGHWYDRHGRQRERWYQRCKRCGTSDGCEVFRRGLLEAWRWWRLRRWWRERCAAAVRWWRTDCEDCGRPTVRFGRVVDGHEHCDVIPF